MYALSEKKRYKLQKELFESIKNYPMPKEELKHYYQECVVNYPQTNLKHYYQKHVVEFAPKRQHLERS